MGMGVGSLLAIFFCLVSLTYVSARILASSGLHCLFASHPVCIARFARAKEARQLRKCASCCTRDRCMSRCPSRHGHHVDQTAAVEVTLFEAVPAVPTSWVCVQDSCSQRPEFLG